LSSGKLEINKRSEELNQKLSNMAKVKIKNKKSLEKEIESNLKKLQQSQ